MIEQRPMGTGKKLAAIVVIVVVIFLPVGVLRADRTTVIACVVMAFMGLVAYLIGRAEDRSIVQSSRLRTLRGRWR